MDLQLLLSLSLSLVSLNNIILKSDAGTLAMPTSGCLCPSINLTYKCFVPVRGVIIWKGSAFRNNCEITLLHNQKNFSCNGGSIVGNSLANANGSYISVLYVVLNFDIIGRSIECFHHNSSNNIATVLTEIGRSLITVSVSHRYLTDHLLKFIWNSSIFSKINCSAIHYNISTQNCGSCPTTTNHTTVTCTDVPTDGGLCTFIVQILVCKNYIGSANESFPLKTAGPGLVSLSLILTAGILVSISALVMVLLWFLYKRYRTSKGFSQSSAAVTMHCQSQNSLDANVYGDNMITLKVFDNKLASGIYGSAAGEARRSQYEDYVPTAGEGKLDLESLRAYLRGRVTFQWYKFGAALGIPTNVLEKFVKDSEKYSEEKALIKVLEYWLKNHPTQPSWHEVANALRDIIWTS